MVVPGGVEVEFADEFAVGGEHSDVEVVDEDEDAGAGVAAADADVVESAVVPQGEYAGGVDAVVAGAPVAGVDRCAGRDGRGPGGVGLGGGAAIEGAVRPAVVVVGGRRRADVAAGVVMMRVAAGRAIF